MDETNLLNNIVKISDIVKPIAATLSNQPYGLSSGNKTIDDITFGYQPTEMTILAGRSSMGKTAYAIDVALNISKDKNVLFLSIEMSRKVLVQRMLSNLSEIKLTRLKTNDITKEEEIKLQQTIVSLENRKLLIDDSSLLTPAQCFYKIKNLGNVDFVIIDYLQLMVSGERDTGNLTQTLDRICQNLRATAKYFNIPILVLSQLSRKPDERQGHEPRLSDLRDSGGIEQTADVVLLIHRPSYYEMREINIEAKDNGEAYIFIAKNRNGATGKVPVVFFGETMSFREINWKF